MSRFKDKEGNECTAAHWIVEAEQDGRPVPDYIREQAEAEAAAQTGGVTNGR